MSEFPQDTILVALTVDPEGALEKPAAELLGGAAAIGSPVALIVAAEEAHAALAAAAGELGARVVLVAGLGLIITLVGALIVTGGWIWYKKRSSTAA